MISCSLFFIVFSNGESGDGCHRRRPPFSPRRILANYSPSFFVPWKALPVSSILLAYMVKIAHWQIRLQQRLINGAKAAEVS